MALNIAVPLSGVGGLSPISPINLECWEQIKMLVSPIGSESSGVSSLDSEEARQQCQQSSSPNTPDEIAIMYKGRDILDLGGNLTAGKWNLRYAYLPENNMPMYLANRSQYYRLGKNSHIQDYSLVRCEHCDLQYPVNSGSSYFCNTSVTVSPTTNSTMTYTGQRMFNRQPQSKQQQSLQQPQKQQQQLYQSTNNKNSNFSLYNNQMNFNNNFVKKTTVATTISTPATGTISSAAYASSSPTSSLSSGYSSSGSINGGNYSNANANNGGNFSNMNNSSNNGGMHFSQQSPPNGSNMFMNNNNNSNVNNPKLSMSSNTFNNFGSFLNAFSNNNTTSTTNNNNNNGYINQSQANGAGQQQLYMRTYNYF